ncbi:hypothetical protein KKF32_04675 [Patescibacteria group bacterium]|nr:hypothetical protein [Patescibacteria group bacterium]
MKFKSKLKKFWPIIVIVLLFILVSVGYAYYAESYRIDRGQNILIDAVDTLRYRVFNLSATLDYFIPHRTLEEWSAFKQAVESGSLSDLELERYDNLRIVISDNWLTGNLEDRDPNKTWWESANDFCQDDPTTDDNSRWAALLWGYSGGSPYLPQKVIYDVHNYVKSNGQPLFTADGDNQVPTTILNNFTPTQRTVLTGYTGSTCENWGNYNSYGNFGIANVVDQWLDLSNDMCGLGKPIYCVELPRLLEITSDGLDCHGNMDFKVVDVGNSEDLTFTIHNEDPTNLIFDNIQITDPAFNFVNLDSSPLPPDGFRDFTVRFTPTEASFYRGEIIIESNYSAEPTSTPIIGRSGPWIRRIMVTDQGHSGDFDGGAFNNQNWYEAAIDFCEDQMQIQLPGNTSHWHPLLGNPTTYQPRCNYTPTPVFSPETIYVNELGENLFTASADYCSNYYPTTLENRIGEWGEYVWTGFDIPGCINGYDCNKWSNGDSHNYGIIGMAYYTDDRWYSYYGDVCNQGNCTCDENHRLYCVEQDE